MMLWKKEKGNRPKGPGILWVEWGECVTVLNVVIRAGLTDRMTVEQNPKGGEGGDDWSIWGRVSCPGRGRASAKAPRWESSWNLQGGLGGGGGEKERQLKMKKLDKQ